MSFLPLWLFSGACTLLSKNKRNRVLPGPESGEEQMDPHNDEQAAVKHSTTPQGHSRAVRIFLGVPSSDLRNIGNLLPPISERDSRCEGAEEKYHDAEEA